MSSAYNPLEPAISTLYAELLERLLASEAGGLADPPPGSFVRKTIKGRVYCYLQLTEFGRRKQIYLGADSRAMRAELTRIKAAWATRAAATESTAGLVAMLRAGGVEGPDAATGRVLDMLARHHIFAAGGVLIGSHAFAAMGPMLGVRWTTAHRTQDIDLAGQQTVAIAAHGVRGDLPAALAATRFTFDAIPGLDSREPSSSFRVRGQALRLDVLTPLVGRPKAGPVHLAHLGVSARPLRFLDYLIDEVVPAAIVALRGVRVAVPAPARFALHKLLVAAERGVHEQAKVAKDCQQASALLALLADERPGDLELAWKALASRGRGWLSRVERSQRRLDAAAAAVLAGLQNSTG